MRKAVLLTGAVANLTWRLRRTRCGLTETSELMPVDEEVISEAQEWLIKQQKADGSWAPDYGNDRESGRRAAIRTAYIAQIFASPRGEGSKEKLRHLKSRLS